MRVGVLGGGAWGTAVAALAARRSPTRLWAREPDVVDTIRSRRQS